MSTQLSLSDALPWLTSQHPFFVESADHARLSEDLSLAGFDVRSVDGTGLTDERSFVRALGPALSFPSYYGGNWQAFIDCIGDLAEVSEAPAAIVWTDAQVLLKADLQGFVRAVHMLLTAARDLALSDVQFQLEIFVVGEFGSTDSP